MHDAPYIKTDLTDADVETIAREADVDQRTVLRRLLRLPVKGRAAARADAAINRRLGSLPGRNTAA